MHLALGAAHFGAGKRGGGDCASRSRAHVVVPRTVVHAGAVQFQPHAATEWLRRLAALRLAGQAALGDAFGDSGAHDELAVGEHLGAHRNAVTRVLHSAAAVAARRSVRIPHTERRVVAFCHARDEGAPRTARIHVRQAARAAVVGALVTRVLLTWLAARRRNVPSKPHTLCARAVAAVWRDLAGLMGTVIGAPIPWVHWDAAARIRGEEHGTSSRHRATDRRVSGARNLAR